MVAKSVKLVARFLNSSALTRPLMVLGAVSAAWGGASAQSVDPNTLPQGANVVGGNATVLQLGNALNVNQSSNRTVIDWRSFDIGSSAQVNFNQPGASSIAVNRVNNSANPTQIQGGLHANGQVWILNPNGVYFGSSARVDAAGIVASTANIDVNQFMAGSNRLQMTGADRGAVSNAGSISVGQNGLAAFVAPSVRNSGTINAKVGKVTLAAGTTYTLDLAGDRLVEIGLGSVKAVVDQSGKIVNPGGTVALTAKAAGQVVNSVVNVSGLIDASSVTKVGGDIVLGGDDITTTSSAVVKADGGANGNGGTITAVADNRGTYAGTFSAKGGSVSGNGGKIETSGKTVSVAANAKIDASAPHGKAGTWLLDPLDITISTGTDDGVITGATVHTGTIETSLAGGTGVVITTSQTGTDDGDLNLADSINAASTHDAGLTLTGRHLSATGGSTISITGGALTLNVNAVNTLADVSSQSTNWIQDAVNMVGTVSGGSTINLGAATYSAGASINKANVTLNGVAGAVVRVPALADINGINVDANNVTVERLEIIGPATSSYLTFAWGTPYTRGIAVHRGYTGFNITNNNIHDVRNGILIDGINNAGSVTNNRIENTKSGISVQYTDGSGVSINNNGWGTFGNEWGVNLHLNGYWDGTSIHSNPYPGGAAPVSVQQMLLANSAANGGWTLQDQAYTSSNRTAVVVSTTGNDTKQGSAGTPLATIQAGINAVVAGGTVNVAAGSYVLNGQGIIGKSVSIVGDAASRPVITTETDFAGTNAANAWILVNSGVTFGLSNVVLDGTGHNIWQALRSQGNTTVDNVAFRNIMVSGKPYNGVAIESFGGTVAGGAGSDTNGAGGSASHLTVTNSTFENIGRIGVLVKGTGATADITNNTYTGKGAIDTLDYAVEVGASGQATITGNTITGNRGVASTDGSTSAGILVTSYYGGASHATITNNVITGNTSAVALGYDGIDVSVVHASSNDFSGNDYGVTLTSMLATADFSGNWWGTTDKPALLAYLGGAAASSVDVSPFLMTGVDTDVGTRGFQGDFSGLIVTALGGGSVSGRIQEGIDDVTAGGTVYISDGTYTISSGYINVNKSLTLSGQSEAGVIIDARNASTYGMRVSGPNSNVTLENFTLYGVTALGGYGLKAENTSNLTLQNITSQGAYKSEFDLNGIIGGTLDHLTADGYSIGTTTQTGGNGISFTDSQNITLTNSVTRNNAWGGLALYQSNKAGGYAYQETNITVDGTNTFNEANGIYAEDESSTNDFGTLNLTGFDYIVRSPTNPNDIYTWFQRTQQDAINFAAAVAPATAAVEGYAGNSTSGTNIFTVGYNTAGTQALSINAAVNAASAGATVNVLAGTYDQTLDIAKNVDVVGAGVGNTIIRPTTLLTTGVGHKYDANMKVTVFVHDADAVNLKGLTIDGNNLENNAVVFWNNASGSIRESMILNAMTFSGSQTGQGLAVDGTTGHTMNLTVADVTFRDWNKNAIDVVTGNGAATGGGNVNLIVERSTFAGRGPTDTIAQNGIVLWERGGTINATIDGSRFTDIAYTGAQNATAAGVLQYGSPNGSVTVSNSIFDAIQTYISTAGGTLHELNATTGNQFGGVAQSTATLDQLFGIQNHILDGIDEAGNSLVRLVAGNLYVTAAKGSIQKGVNAASSGNTVNVQAGTYSGFGTSFGGPADLTIKTSGGAVIDASGVPVTPITRIVDLRADGTTISGFTIKGNGNDVGISISGQNVTASGNTISDVLTGIQTTTQYPTGNATITGNTITAGYGVSLQNAGNTVSNNTVTAATEGVGLVHAANTTFSDNTFTIAAGGRALNFVDAVSAGGLTASGNTVNIASGDLQGAVYLAGTSGSLNLAAGSYTLGSTLLISNNGLTVKGAGEGATTITSTAAGYGMSVSANDVTLSSFSLNGNPAGSYSIKVSPGGDASSRLLDFAIDHVTINGSKRTGLDLNGVDGATIDYVTVTNSTRGNGITLTDSANVTISNSHTSGNAWGGLALYQDNSYYDQQETNITVEASNAFDEINPVYMQDSSNGTTAHGGATGLDFGTLSIAGFGYAVLNPNGRTEGDGAQFVWLQKNKHAAIDFAMGTFGMTSTSSSYVRGWTGGATSDVFTVGVSTGGQAMSINAAVNASTSGATINVLDGTYAEDVAVGTARTLNLGAVTVDSLTLDAGAAGTQISGKLAGGSIALNGAVTLLSHLILDTSASNGAIVVASVDGSAAGGQDLTLKAGTGTVSLGDVGSTIRLGAVTDTSATTLSGTTYAAGNLGFGAVTLTKDTTFDVSADNGAIVVASVDGTTAGAQALTLKAGTGTVSLGDVGASTRLGAVSDAGAATLTGATYAANSFDLGAVKLAGDATLDTSANNGAIVVASVDGTTAGAQALTLKSGTGTVSLGDVGATTRLGAVADANTTTLTGSTYTANSLGFGALTLAKDATLDTSANNGAIVVASVDGTTAGAQNFTLKSGTGTVSLGDVGATTRLAGVADANTTTLTGSTYTANSLDFTALTLAKDATLDTSANNGRIVIGAVNGTAAGAQALTLRAGSGTVVLGTVGVTTRLGAFSDASTTTLTGPSFTANSFAFSGNVTLTSPITTFDTSAAAGDIVFTGNIFGTTAGQQSLVLNAGSGRGAVSANGDIALQNAGTQTVRLNNLTVTGNAFSALTVALAGNFVSELTGDQVFSADTLDVLGSVNGTVAGNASGHIAAGGAVTLGVTGDLSGTISGGAITLTTGSLTNSTITGTGSMVVGAQTVTGAVLTAPTVMVIADTFDGTIIASNSANVQAGTIGGTFTAGTVTLAATDTVTATVTADTLNMSASTGDVNGTWTTVNTTGNGTIVVNGENNLGNSGANPNQLVVEGFALPLGTQVTPSGEIVLPQGMVLGLLSPGGTSKPRVILVHDVRSLGRLLEEGYIAIVIDLSGRDKDKEETLLASN